MIGAEFRGQFHRSVDIVPQVVPRCSATTRNRHPFKDLPHEEQFHELFMQVPRKRKNWGELV
jgi:hypothetical protein